MKWNFETRKISDLKNNPKNPRRLNKNDSEQLMRSLQKFGVCEPIIINTDNTIIGGHQRVKTLKKMGEKEVVVCVPESALDDRACDELNVRLNKNTGDWDDDVLANQWEIEDLLDWGFLPDELGFILDEDDKKEEEKEEHKCPVCGKKSDKPL